MSIRRPTRLGQVIFIALLLSAVGTVGTYGAWLDDTGERAAARRMFADGEHAKAKDVEMLVPCQGRRCSAFGSVRATVRGHRVYLDDVRVTSYRNVAREVWLRPAAGTRYGAPIDVLIDPDDPSEVMAVVDARIAARDSSVDRDVAIMAVSGPVSVLLVVVLLVRWRAARRARLR